MSPLAWLVLSVAPACLKPGSSDFRHLLDAGYGHAGMTTEQYESPPNTGPTTLCSLSRLS